MIRKIFVVTAALAALGVAACKPNAQTPADPAQPLANQPATPPAADPNAGDPVGTTPATTGDDATGAGASDANAQTAAQTGADKN
jgi:hypothetical protein